MVAISMYRGNLHRVPDVPRRWQIPPQPLPLSRFKSLLSRRSSSLSLRNPSLVPVKREPIPNLDNERPAPCSSLDNARGPPSGSGEVTVLTAPAEANNGTADGGEGADHSKMEVIKTENVDRKNELEKKLSILNEKKHHLVQMLKQILNAEEEMKKRIMTYSAASRSSSNPFPADASVDQGSVGRHTVPKLSVDVCAGIDPGPESELVSNQYSQAHPQQLSCASPSASLSRPIHGSFQRNSAFQSPRASSLSGTGNTTPVASMFSGGGSMVASPRLPSGPPGTSGNAVSGAHL